MAKTTEKKTASASLPSGFEPVSVEGPQTWAHMTEGNVIQGELLGRFSRRGGNGGSFYQIKLTKECAGTRGRAADREDVDCEAGETVCIDEKARLMDFAELVKADRRYEVYVEIGKKIKLDGGKTMWEIKAGKKDIGPKAKAA